MTRTTTRLACLIALIGASGFVYACGSSDSGGGAGGASGSSSNNNGNSGSGNNAGSGSNNAGSANNNNGGSSNNGGANNSNNGGANNNNGGSNNSTGGCDPTDPTGQANMYPAAQECAQTECQDAYQQCLGANYQDGDYSGGECEAYMECSTACDCDETCLMGCDFAGACQDCFTNTVGGCVFNNCSDTIFGGDAGIPGLGGGGSCADLQACCDSLAADEQAGCLQAYGFASQIGDIGCSAVIGQYPTCAQ